MSMSDVRRYMQYDPILGQAQDHEPLKVGNSLIFRSYLLRQGSWQLTTDY